VSVAISSKRYAQAIFQIAKDKGTLEQWRIDLKKIADLMQSTEFASVIENPRLPLELKAELTRKILGVSNLLALNLAYLLIAKGKFKNAGQISKEFDHLVNEYLGIKHAEAITAVPMDNTDKVKLKQQLAALIGSKVEIEFKVDPTIMGGIIARVDGSLIDGSVRNSLEMLRKNMVGMSK